MTTLFLWTIITVSAGAQLHRDWRPMAEFSTMSQCEEAARQLNVLERYRCVRTK